MNLFCNELTFDESEHRYFVDGKPLRVSVSGIVSKFKEPFDAESTAQCIAERDGTTKEFVLAYWKSISDKACELGTNTHEFGELYATDRSLKPQSSYEKAVVNFWNDIPGNIKLYATELQMYHKKYLFGGTADIIMKDTKTDTLVILDYKTNKDLFKNFKEQKMLSPFDDLLDMPINHYQLQLSLYQIMLEQFVDIPVSRRTIVWLKSTGEYEMYDCQDYTKELNEWLSYARL